jgi:hypothetical protein
MTAPKSKDPLRWLRNIAIIWLLFLAAYSLGYLTRHQSLWPDELLSQVSEFVVGDSEEQTTLTEKVLNDFGLKPGRHIVETQKAYDIPDHYQPLEGLGLASRRVDPLLHLAPEAPRGFRDIRCGKGQLFGKELVDEGLSGELRQQLEQIQDQLL